MIPIVSLLVVLTLSLLVTRVATVALTMTGLSEDLARFQARSAFTGCGYSTSETERVIEHPVRRRIVMVLMLLGNAGLVTAIAALISGFLDTQNSAFSPVQRFGVLGLGLLALWGVGTSAWIDRHLSKLIRRMLKRFTSLETYDYLGLLHLSDGYTVIEAPIDRGNWMAGRSLADLRLAEEGVQMLGIHRANGEFIGTPAGSTYVRSGDRIIVYGRQGDLCELEARRAGADGDQAHANAVARQCAAVADQAQGERHGQRAADQQLAQPPAPGLD